MTACLIRFPRIFQVFKPILTGVSLGWSRFLLFYFPFITLNLCMGRVREKESVREKERVREKEIESLRRLSLHTNWGWLYGSSTNRFFFVLLLTQDWYRAILRHRIIVVSSRIPTFLKRVYLGLFSASQPRAVWRKARAARDGTSSSYPPPVSLWSPFITAGHIIFLTPMQILGVAHPVCLLRVVRGHAPF